MDIEKEKDHNTLSVSSKTGSESKAAIAGHVAQVFGGGMTSDDIQIPGFSKEYSGWDVYNNEARKVDMELVKDWTSTLNSLLVFASIFAAVLTAFIIDSGKLLEQNPADTIVDVMIFQTNNLANGTYKPYVPQPFEPTSSSISILCLFFASLILSLVAALTSVIALQWVSDYESAITRGGSSPEDRAKRRQFRHAGIVWWKMGDIISALPLLLSCSVALFLIGLTVRMWVILPILGIITGTGTGIAVLIYGLSTLLSVFSAFAPFRTPLSQWGYQLFLLFSVIIYRTARRAHITFLHPWFERQDAKFQSKQTRGDRAVSRGSHLGKDALVWLATQLSVSRDSYRRFLLLVSELPSLRLDQLPPLDSTDVSWYRIFDFLALGYFERNQCTDITPEDRHGMIILQKCWEIPAVRGLVTPTGKLSHLVDVEDRTHWKEHAEPWKAGSDCPNRLFFLLRDLPIIQNSSSEEVDAVIRLSRWRNSEEKPLQTWTKVLDAAASFSDPFLSTCIHLFGMSIRNSANGALKDGEEQLRLSIIGNLVQMAITRKGITSEAIRSLTSAYEFMLSGYGDITKQKCIATPLKYGWALQRRPLNEHAIHDGLILLLARQLYRLPSEEKNPGAQRKLAVQEIIAMLWLRPSNPSPRDYFRLANLYGWRCRISDLGSRIQLPWIGHALQIPHISEIMLSLANAQAKDPSIGSLWGTTASHSTSDLQFVEALSTFDEMIHAGCGSDEHQSLINLVCQELECRSLQEFRGYFNADRIASVFLIQDPCLRFLANWTVCDENIVPVMELSREEGAANESSWLRIEAYLFASYQDRPHLASQRLETLWHSFPGRKMMYTKAFKNPLILRQIRSIFSCDEGSSVHSGDYGRLLFEILDNTPSNRFPCDLRLYGNISLKDRIMDTLPIMLCRSRTAQRISLKSLIDGTDDECTKQLEEMLDAVESSAYQFISFLRRFLDEYQKRNMWAEDIAIILECIDTALNLPHEVYLPPVLRLLTNELKDISKRFVTDGCGLLEERELVFKQALKVIHRIDIVS